MKKPLKPMRIAIFSAILSVTAFIPLSCGNLMNDIMNEINSGKDTLNTGSHITATYSLTYDGNGNTGGTVPVDNSLYAEGMELTVSANTGGLVKEAYLFSGWNTTADGSGTGYAESSTFIMGNADATLYAAWQALTQYTLTFDANGGSGSMAAQIAAAGTTLILTANSFTRTGYDFVGWSGSSDGAITHSDRGTYTFAAADATLFARWNSNNSTAPSSFSYTNADGKITITDFTGTETVVVIPDLIDSCPVTAIGDDAFRHCIGLMSVVIPDSVTHIGDLTFVDCTTLISVVIPDSVTSIGFGTFALCTGLSSVVIPNSVTSIGDNAFQYCTSLTSLVIPNSVTVIGIYSFHECSALSSVVIPDSVTFIGDSAFSECSALTSVTVNTKTPPTLGGVDVFDFNAINRKFYVPASADDSIINAYKTATYWSEYAASIFEQ